MAAVLHPFLRDSLLAQTMLAMVWHFHGLEAQIDACKLNVAENVCESTGRMALRVRSMQYGWPIQVVKKITVPGNYRHLELSDSMHDVRAVISNEAVKKWEYQSKQSFDDIVPGTLLQVNISHFMFRPNRSASKKKRLIPYAVLRSFKLAGCQGENIFGRPSSLQDDPRFKVINRTLAWWAARHSEPLAEKHAANLIKSHEAYAMKQSNQLSDQYLSWLCDQLGANQSDAEMNIVTNFAKSIPAVSDTLSYSQQIGLSASIPSVSILPQSKSRNKQAQGEGHGDLKAREGKESKKDQSRSRLRTCSIISIEDQEDEAIDEAPTESSAGVANFTALTPPPDHGAVSTSPSNPTMSPLFSPFVRGDAKVRKQQHSFVADKNEASWMSTNSHETPFPRLPEPMLEVFVAQVRDKNIQRVAETKVNQDSTGDATLNSIEVDDQQLPASQHTVYAQEWDPSPSPEDRVPARVLPPDTDDEGDQHESDDELHSVGEEETTEEWQLTTEDPAKTSESSDLANKPRVDLEQGLAEPAGFALESESSSPAPTSPPAPRPVSAPSTPVVQIPATVPSAPSTVQVPATTGRTVLGSGGRKRRSEEFEADNVPERSIIQAPTPSSAPVPSSSLMEDPVEKSKRDRAAFMAQCHGDRAKVTEALPQAPPSSAPVIVSRTSPAPAPPAETKTKPASASASAPAPTGLHAEFIEAYPTYRGSAAHFAALASVAAAESAGGRLPQYALDDFVLRHHAAYEPFVQARVAAGAIAVPDYVAFFAAEVRSLEATRGVLNVQNVITAAGAAAGGMHKETKKKRRVTEGEEAKRRDKSRKSASKVFAAFAAKKK